MINYTYVMRTTKGKKQKKRCGIVELPDARLEIQLHTYL